MRYHPVVGSELDSQQMRVVKPPSFKSVGESTGACSGLRIAALSCAALVGSTVVRADSTPSDDGDDRPGIELITANVRVLDPPALAPGESGELSLLLLETPDRDMPLTVRLDAGAVELVENRLGWSSVVDPLAPAPRVRAPFRAPSEPGRHEVRATVDYSICSRRWCRSKHAEIGWTVIVEPGPPA